jgi:hypothetical protein
MRIVASALLLLALPAWTATPATGCGNLCGRWQLDTTLSVPAAPAIDAALSTYKDPRARRVPRAVRGREGPQIETNADRIQDTDEWSLGPIHDRPQRGELRTELISLLNVPAQLSLDAKGTDILIQGDSQAARRLSPGTPKARVNSIGLAKINASWKSNRLTITERYDKKRTYSETYVLQGTDGTLIVTREVQRPGLKALKIQSVYRRG